MINKINNTTNKVNPSVKSQLPPNPIIVPPLIRGNNRGMLMYLHSKQKHIWSHFAFLSLILTFCSGLQALAFWTIRLDFDISWWIPNLYLLVYPCFFLKSVWRECGWYETNMRKERKEFL